MLASRGLRSLGPCIACPVQLSSPHSRKTLIQWLDADNALTLLTIRSVNSIDWTDITYTVMQSLFRVILQFKFRKYKINSYLLSAISSRTESDRSQKYNLNKRT